MNKEGVRDLMEKHRYKPSHLQKILIEQEVPGRWAGKSGLQNVYNLVNGRITPKDGYVFIFLADLLQINTREILKRFSVKTSQEKSDGRPQIDW